MSEAVTNDQCLNDLRRARGFIEAGWCKFRRGESASGSYRDGFDPEAVRWCALGAIDAALGRYVNSNDCPVREVARHVPRKWHYGGTLDAVADFNNDDKTTKEDVLALFDRAIAEHAIGAGFAAFRAATLTALERSQMSADEQRCDEETGHQWERFAYERDTNAGGYMQCRLCGFTTSDDGFDAGSDFDDNYF